MGCNRSRHDRHDDFDRHDHWDRGLGPNMDPPRMRRREFFDTSDHRRRRFDTSEHRRHRRGAIIIGFPRPFR